MKRLQVLVVTTLAATALIGLGTASATRLCGEHALACPAGQILPEKTELEGKLKTGTKSIFEAGKFKENGEFELIYKIECNESVATAKTTNEGGGEGVPVLADVTGVTNLNSKGKCPVNKELVSCSITAVGTPYAGSLEFEGNEVFFGDGSLTMVEKGGAGQPRFQFSCLGGTVTCFYGKPAPFLRITGGEPWLATATKEKVERLVGSSGACPAIAFWSAQYEGVKPAKMWLSAK